MHLTADHCQRLLCTCIPHALHCWPLSKIAMYLYTTCTSLLAIVKDGCVPVHHMHLTADHCQMLLRTCTGKLFSGMLKTTLPIKCYKLERDIPNWLLYITVYHILLKTEPGHVSGAVFSVSQHFNNSFHRSLSLSKQFSHS